MDSDESSSHESTTTQLELLLGPLRERDERAIAAFFAIADQRIRLVAQRILRGDPGKPDGRTDEIISLSSEALLTQLRGGLFAHCDSLRQLMGYLAEIIRNKAIDAARRSSGVKSRTQFPAQPLPADHAGSVGERSLFYEMIADLPARQREIVDLKIMWSFNFREIADLMGLSETVAKVNYANALRRLKRDFDDLGSESKPRQSDDADGESRSSG